MTMGPAICLSFVMMATLAGVAHAAGPTRDVLTYHATIDRRGEFVVPGLTWARARSLHIDAGFRPRITGHIYAQPLYWREGPQGFLLVATESDDVYALDASTGRTIWRKNLGEPVSRGDLPCGNIDPLGITGAPTIDADKQAVYLDAMVSSGSARRPEHEIFSLSLKDGSIRQGWPVNVAAELAASGRPFIAANQNERGALTLVGHRLYVPYGGHFGDCADYHGWVVSVNVDEPRRIASWRTAAQAGGIWAPGGASSDGGALFVATGNTMQAARWGGGEAVIRLTADLAFSNAKTDFFAASDWRRLDDYDEDLGGTAPVLFSAGSRVLALALGKSGKADLLDRRDLGGLGGSLVSKQVSQQPIRTAPAVYAEGDQAMVAFDGPGSGCRDPRRGVGLTVLKIRGGASPALDTAWCAALRGHGSPIATTVDGSGQPIVWILGAEGDNRLYGFRGDTGERLFMSDPLPGLRHFQTLIATPTRLYVAADDAVFAFAF